MPFTLSHPAIVLPLARTPMAPSALVMGSVAPDLPYFLPASAERTLTHRFIDTVTVDLGLALLLLGLFHLVLKWPLIALCPEWVRRRLAAPARAFDERRMGDLGWLLLSASVGTVSHVGWDAFTHAGAPGVRRFPALDETFVLGLPGFKVAQYASSVIGLLAVVVWTGWRLRRTMPVGDDPPGLSIRGRTAVLAGTAAAGLGGGCFGALVWLPLNTHRTDFHARVVGGLIGTISFAALALIVYGLAFRASPRWTRMEGRMERGAARSEAGKAGLVTQSGIFGLGTPEHCYLEFDLRDGTSAVDLVKAVAALTGPLSTGGGVNLVVGFRPELWARIEPGGVPSGARSFTEPVVGTDGFQMPATQHDAWLWIAGGDRTAVFNNTRDVVAALADVATVASEVTGWLYQHDRDLTGFIDGTENPSLLEAPDVAVVPAGAAAGSSIVLVQQWRHNSDSFQALTVEEQEKVIGRTKADSVELDEAVMPATSHVSRTVVEEDGEELKIFRRNTAFGTVTDHGTMFVGFSGEQRRLEIMLRRMAGSDDGVRDALTRYTTPVTGAYYLIPSVPALAGFVPEEAD